MKALLSPLRGASPGLAPVLCLASWAPRLVSERDVQEVLAALERLRRHEVISPDEALEAARLVTGDPTFTFPPPAPEGAPGEPTP